MGALHLLESHADEYVFDAIGGLSEDVFAATLDARRVGRDVVLGELDVLPLAAGQQFGGEPIDRLGGFDALHQGGHSLVG